MISKLEEKLVELLKHQDTSSICAFKVECENGMLDYKSNKDCKECDGYSSVIECRTFVSVNHLLNFYERYLI